MKHAIEVQHVKAERKPRSNRVASNVGLGLILLLLVLLIGCDSREVMRERFGDQKVEILTDDAGKKYVVEHRFGSNYSLKPIKRLSLDDGGVCIN